MSLEGFGVVWTIFEWKFFRERISPSVPSMIMKCYRLHPISGLLFLSGDEHQSQTASNGRVWNTPNCNANALSITLLRPVHHFFSSNIILKKNTFLIA